jgi:DNA-binding NarL/FixJ family response regulator
MDLVMPVMDGITATALLRQEMPDVEILTLTCMPSTEHLVAAMQAGAIGYLLKTTEAQALCTAIKAAAAGQIQLSPESASRLLARRAAPTGHETLTDRETEILRFLAQGLSNKAIARALDIGVQTVKSHVAHVLDKLGAASRTQAVLLAMQAGLVPTVGLGGQTPAQGVHSSTITSSELWHQDRVLA